MPIQVLILVLESSDKASLRFRCIKRLQTWLIWTTSVSALPSSQWRVGQSVQGQYVTIMSDGEVPPAMETRLEKGVKHRKGVFSITEKRFDPSSPRAVQLANPVNCLGLLKQAARSRLCPDLERPRL